MKPDRCPSSRPLLFRPNGFSWITLRVALGFTGLTLLLLSAAWSLKLLPDRNYYVLRERASLAESLAIVSSGLTQVDRPEAVRPMIEEIVRRNPALLSVGVRDNNGTLVIDIGNHEGQWTNRIGNQSTDSEMKVPIVLQDTLWGGLELHFAPLYPNNHLAILQDDILRLFVFVALTSLIVYSWFVWRILRSVLLITSSDAIPKHIRAFLNTLVEGLLILDKEQRIVVANEAFARLLDRPLTEIEGTDVSRLPWIQAKDGDGTATLYPWEQSGVTGESYTGVLLACATEGELPTTLSINSTAIFGDDGSIRGTIVTFDNVTKLDRMNKRLRRVTQRLKELNVEIDRQNKVLQVMATHDSLTECLNKRAFFAQMDVLWGLMTRYRYPLCCIMVDIDNFKRINDDYGHSTGDQVICHVAKILQAGKRAGDIVARYGGEEFALLLPHLDISSALVVANRMRQCIENTPCGDIYVTVSMGVSVASSGGKDSNNLLHQADLALYDAKHGGRNRVCCWKNRSNNSSIAS